MWSLRDLSRAPPIEVDDGGGDRSCVLRELVLGVDEDAVLRWAEDPEVYRYQTWGPSSPEHVRRFLEHADRERRQSPRQIAELGIDRDGDLIGLVGLHVASSAHRRCTLSFTLRRDRWGLGIAARAGRAGLQLARHCGAHRVQAYCDPENERSRRVLEKLGLEREGRLRHYVYRRGEWRDALLFARLLE